MITQIAQGGLYSMVASNHCGTSTASVNVSVNALPSSVLAGANSTTICLGNTLDLSASAMGIVDSWSWSGPAGFSSANQQPSLVLNQFNQTGDYVVSATNTCGTVTTSIHITVVDAPPTNAVALAAADSVCLLNTLTLSGSATGTISSWSWTGPGGYTSNIQNPTIGISSLAQGGSYVMTATNNCGSITASVSVSIINNSAPSNVIASSGSNPACVNDIVNLAGQAVGAVDSWLWTGPLGFTSPLQHASLQILSANQAGTYLLTASNECGIASSSFQLNINDKPSNASLSASINPVCEGGVTDLSGTAMGNIFTWTITGPGGFSTTGPTATINTGSVSQSGYYTLTASNNCGNTYDSIYLDVNPLPVLNPLLLAGNYLVVSSPDLLNQFEWYYNGLPQGVNNDSLLCSADGDYYCIAWSADNCMALSDTLNVVCTSVGIKEILGNSLSVFPNPVNGTLFIRADVLPGRYRLSLTNTLGQEIRKIDLHVRSNRLEAEMNLTDEAAGVYYLSLMGEREKWVIRVSKN